MKNILKNKTKQSTGFFSICLMALFVFVIACEIPQDAGSVLEIRAETNIFSHKAFISIRDLADQNNLNGNVLKAKIIVLNDNRSNIIVSEGGDYGDIINIIDGVAAFAVNPSYRYFTAPIDLILEIYGNDYLTKTILLTINPEDFNTEINETVLKISDVPDGVGVKQQNVTLSGGSNSNSISVSTNASSDGTSADVNVPAVNIFKDINGNNINSGNLSLQVVYFDGSNDDASRASINGNIGSLKDENGQTLTNVVLAPLATVDVNMTVGGTEVKKFGKPIDIIMEINKNMINPNTKAKVAVGDEINIYSTSDNVNWSFIGKEKVTSASGKLLISFKTDHLSTFSAAFKVDTCTNGKATLTLPDDGKGFATVYLGKFITTNEGASYPTIGFRNGAQLSLVNAPSVNASLVLEPFFSSGSIVTINDIAWCGPAVSSPNTDQLKTGGETIDLTISAKCPSGTSSIIPSKVKLFIDYDRNGYYKEVGLIENGKILIPGIVLNKTYDLKVVYDGKSGFGSYNFTSKTMKITDYDLPGEVCENLKL